MRLDSPFVENFIFFTRNSPSKQLSRDLEKKKPAIAGISNLRILTNAKFLNHAHIATLLRSPAIESTSIQGLFHHQIKKLELTF